MSKSKLPSSGVFLASFALITAALATALVLLHGPTRPLIVLIAPILFASLYYPRRVFLTTVLITCAAAITVAYYVPTTDFSGMLKSAVLFGATMVFATEMVHRLVSARMKAEAAMRESEANYHAIFDAADDAILVHDIETGAILDVNRKMCEMFGYTPEEARELDVEALSSAEFPYDQRGASQWMQKAAAGEPQLFEWLARDRVGRVFWVEVNLKRTSIRGKDRLLAIVRDITTRKHAEEALRQSEESLRQVIDLVPHMIFAKNLHGRFLLVNRAAARAYGMTAVELVGKRQQDVHPDPREVERFLRNDREVIDSGHARLIPEESFLGQDGKRRILQTTRIPYRVTGVGELAVLEIAIDITERKQAEEALRESEEKFSTAFLRSPFPIAISKRDGGEFIDVNESFVRTTGYSRDEVIGRTFAELNMYEPLPDRPPAEQLFQEKGFVWAMEGLLRTKSGEMRAVRFSAQLIEIKGEPCVLAIGEDITDRKRAVEALKSARDELEKRVEERTADLTAVNKQLRDEIADRQRAEKTLHGSEEQFRTLAEAIPVAIFIAQRDRVLYVNSAAETMSGYSRAELLKMTPWDICHPDYRQLVRDRSLARQHGEHVPERYQIKALTKQGEERWIELFARKFEFEGQPASLTIIVDIAERKRAEEGR